MPVRQRPGGWEESSSGDREGPLRGQARGGQEGEGELIGKEHPTGRNSRGKCLLILTLVLGRAHCEGLTARGSGPVAILPAPWGVVTGTSWDALGTCLRERPVPLGLAQCPSVRLQGRNQHHGGKSMALLVGTSQPAAVSPAHTVSDVTPRLCDSRQVSNPLWAHKPVNEVTSGLGPQPVRKGWLTVSSPLPRWPPHPSPLQQVGRQVCSKGPLGVGQVGGVWVSLTQSCSSPQAGQEAAAPRFLQAAFRDCSL